MRRLLRLPLLVALATTAAILGALMVFAAAPRQNAEAAPPSPSRSAATTTDVRSHWFRMSTVVHETLVPNHRNYAARTTASGPLLLLLSATGKSPSDYSRFLRLATDSGYHVLGLDYWNVGRSVASTCGTDSACYGQLQRNRFDGSRPSRFSHVAPRDSVLGRLKPALTYLRREDPHGGWGQYLGSGGVRWDRVVLAGHSQGGGESAFIAHIRSVRGALLFGSPIVTDGRAAATWLSGRGRTPVDRIYAFDNTSDVFWPRIAASWRLLGLGAPEAVDGRTTFSAHALVSERRQPHAHIRMLADSTLLDARGVPVYEPVWSWMLQRFLPARTARA